MIYTKIFVILNEYINGIIISGSNQNLNLILIFVLKAQGQRVILLKILKI